MTVTAAIDGAATTPAPSAAASAPTFVGYDASRPPVVSSLRPAYGPVAGGATLEVVGANFAPTASLACVFEELGSSVATLVDATTLRCLSPAAPSGAPTATALSITLDHASLSPSSLPFALHADATPPALRAIHPLYVPASGGADLALLGTNFDPHADAAACIFRFGGAPADDDAAATADADADTAASAEPLVSAATYVGVDLMRCTSPSIGERPGGTARVSLWAVPSEGHLVGLPLLHAAREVARHPQAAVPGSLTPVAVSLTFFRPASPPRVDALVPRLAAIDGAGSLATVAVRGSNFAPTGARLLCALSAVGADAPLPTADAAAADGVVAATTFLGTFINGSAVACTLPLPSAPGDRAVHISTDGGRVWSAPATLTFFEPLLPPTVVAVAPATVDVASPPPRAVVVRGGNFAPTAGLICGYGGYDADASDGEPAAALATFISASEVRCAPPDHWWRAAHVHVSHDGGKRWSVAAVTILTYNSSAMPAVTSLCQQADGHASVPPRADDALECDGGAALPVRGAAGALLLRGSDFFRPRGSADFACVFRTLSVPPPGDSAAPAAAQSVVDRLGAALGSFGGHADATQATRVTPATLLDAHHVRCAAPSATHDGPHAASVALSFDGGTTSGASAILTFYDPSAPMRITAASPPAGERTLATPIVLHGYNYAPAAAAGALRCRFGGVSTPATFVHAAELACHAPPTQALGVVPISLSTNGGVTWSADRAGGVYFVYFDSSLPPRVAAVEPPAARVTGGVELVLRGINFVPPTTLPPTRVLGPAQAPPTGASAAAIEAPPAADGSDGSAAAPVAASSPARAAIVAPPPVAASPSAVRDAPPPPPEASPPTPDSTASPPSAAQTKPTTADGAPADVAIAPDLVGDDATGTGGGDDDATGGGDAAPATPDASASPDASATPDASASPDASAAAAAAASVPAAAASAAVAAPARRLAAADEAAGGAECVFYSHGVPIGASAARYISYTEVRCDAPAVPPATTDATVVLTAGGLASSGAAFTFYDASTPPAIAAIDPLGLPTHGAPSIVRVHGSGFAPLQPSCLFGAASSPADSAAAPSPATFVSSTLLLCTSPPAAARAQSIPFAVSRGEGAAAMRSPPQLVAPGSPPAMFTYFDPRARPQTTSAYPRAVDLRGGSVVRVGGSGFQPVGSELQCTVGGLHVPAHFVSLTAVMCDMPIGQAHWVRDGASVRVCVLHGSAQPAADECGAMVTYYDPSMRPAVTSLAPRLLPIGAADADRIVVVSGANFAPTGDSLLCQFGALEAATGGADDGADDGAGAVAVSAPASFVSGDEIRCAAPHVALPGTATVRVSIDGGATLSATARPFAYYAASRPPALASITPPYAGLDSASLLRIAGGNLAPTASLACRFGSLPPTPATFASSGEASCRAPRSPTIQTVGMSMSLDGVHWAAPARPFTFYDDSTPPAVRNVSRVFGSTRGGEAPLLVSGANFAPTAESLRCRFRPQPDATADGAPPAATAAPPVYSPASFVSIHQIRCAAPPISRPCTADVSASTAAAGGGFGASSAVYTYYDPAAPPRVSRVSPAAGTLASAASKTVTLYGSNFAPTPALRARWGELGVSAATFVSSSVARATPRLPPEGRPALSVPVEVSLSDSFGAPPPLEAAWHAPSLFTYYNPYLPPRIARLEPDSHRCADGGRTVVDTRSGAPVEVSATSVVAVRGENFAPLPKLSCVFRRTGESLFDAFEYSVPALFGSSAAVSCPIPRVVYADDGLSLSSKVFFSVSNDAVTYRYTSHTFTFVGDCKANQFTKTMYALVGGLGAALALALIVGALVALCRACRGTAAAAADGGRAQLAAGGAVAGATAAHATPRALRDGGWRPLHEEDGGEGDEEDYYYDEAAFRRPPPGSQRRAALTAGDAYAPRDAYASQPRSPPSAPPSGGSPVLAPSSTRSPWSVGAAVQPRDGARRRPVSPPSPPSPPPELLLGASSASERLAASGVLEVHVQCASGLRAAQSDGLSHPYVSVKVAGRKQWKSSVQPQTLNPTWDETYRVQGTLSSLLAQPLVVTVVDREMLSAGDSLGSLSVRLDRLVDADRLDFSRQPLMGLEAAKGSTVSFTVSFTELAHDADGGSVGGGSVGGGSVGGGSGSAGLPSLLPSLLPSPTLPPHTARLSGDCAADGGAGASRGGSEPPSPAHAQGGGADRSAASPLVYNLSTVTEASAVRAGRPGTLEVHLRSGSDLMAADAAGYSDPYVTIKLRGHKTWRSSLQQKTLAPVWDETMRLRGTLGDFLAHTLHVKVFDKDFLDMGDDRLGTTRLPLDGLASSNEIDVPRLVLQDATSGTLSLSVRFTPDDAGPSATPPATPAGPADPAEPLAVAAGSAPPLPMPAAATDPAATDLGEALNAAAAEHARAGNAGQ